MNELVRATRLLEIDHRPDGWPCVQMGEISALCDLVEDLEAKLQDQTIRYHTRIKDLEVQLQPDRILELEQRLISKEDALCASKLLIEEYEKQNAKLVEALEKIRRWGTDEYDEFCILRTEEAEIASEALKEMEVNGE